MGTGRSRRRWLTSLLAGLTFVTDSLSVTQSKAQVSQNHGVMFFTSALVEAIGASYLVALVEANGASYLVAPVLDLLTTASGSQSYRKQQTANSKQQTRNNKQRTTTTIIAF